MQKKWYSCPLIKISRKQDDFKSLLAALVLNTQIIKIFTIINPIVDVFFQGLLFCICLPKISESKYKNIKSRNIIYILTFAYLFCIGIVSLLYSSSREKIMIMLKFIFISLTCLSVLTFTVLEIERTLKFYIFINLMYSIVILLHRLPPTGDFTYLNLSLSLGCACCLEITKLFYEKLNLRTVILFAILIVGLFYFPARGPVIFLFLTATLALFLSPNKKRNIVLFLFLFGLLLVYLFLLPHDSFDFASRLLSMFASHNLETGERNLIYSKYNQAIYSSWFSGYGIGSSYSMLNGIGYYPHNYILQVWGEFGFLAFILILFINIKIYLSYFIRRIRAVNFVSPLMVELFFALSYFEFQFLKSFDFLSSYPLWIFFIFLLISLNQGEIKK